MTERREFLKIATLLVAGIPMPVSATGRTKLAFVHGRDQQGKDPTLLKAQWLDTLAAGARKVGRSVPGDLDVAFPYYGDLLDEFAQRSEVPLTSDIRSKGGALTPDEEFLRFEFEIGEALRERSGVTDEQVEAEYDGGAKPKGPLNWEWVQAILRAVDKHGGG